MSDACKWCGYLEYCTCQEHLNSMCSVRNPSPEPFCKDNDCGVDDSHSPTCFILAAEQRGALKERERIVAFIRNWPKRWADICYLSFAIEQGDHLEVSDG